MGLGDALEWRRWGPRGWLAVFLGASILTSRFLPTQGQDQSSSPKSSIPITWEPSQPFVGGNITLTPGGKPGFESCAWSRKHNVERHFLIVYTHLPSLEIHLGPHHSGRETADPRCSLHITNLTLEDSGSYMVNKEGQDFETEVGEAEIRVKEPVPDPPANKGVIAGLTVRSLAGAPLIGLLF